MKYTKSEIKILIYIKNNSCRGIKCNECLICKRMPHLYSFCSDRISKKIAKLILESVISKDNIMIYTKEQIKTLIYIKNNSCHDIEYAPIENLSSKKIAKSILESIVLNYDLHKERN